MDFILPKNKSNPIKVIGVGGAGGNAVNHMYELGIKDVDFVVCNTDADDLKKSPVVNKIQIGVKTTEGGGAGGDPEIGEKSAQENIGDIENILGENTKMVFITAGMGGGTGTGAAPIISKLTKEKGILTVAIVTIPRIDEGPLRKKSSEQGLKNIIPNVDSLLIIDNNKIGEIYGDDLTIKEAFKKTDEVLSNSAKSMAEIITKTFFVNIDLADAKKVLKNSGKTIMGKGISKGENRALEAVKNSLNLPILSHNNTEGANSCLLLITYPPTKEATMSEMETIIEYVRSETKNTELNIIKGMGEDEELDDGELAVTLVATGFDKIPQIPNKKDIKKNNIPTDKDILKLEEEREVTEKPNTIKFNLPQGDKNNITVFNLDDDDDIKVIPNSDLDKFNLNKSKENNSISKSSRNFSDEDIEKMENEPAFKRRGIDFND